MFLGVPYTLVFNRVVLTSSKYSSHLWYMMMFSVAVLSVLLVCYMLVLFVSALRYKDTAEMWFSLENFQ